MTVLRRTHSSNVGAKCPHLAEQHADIQLYFCTVKPPPDSKYGISIPACTQSFSPIPNFFLNGIQSLFRFMRFKQRLAF
jgi:hypothetical protein